jgi:hypothetical protein
MINKQAQGETHNCDQAKKQVKYSFLFHLLQLTHCQQQRTKPWKLYSSTHKWYLQTQIVPQETE